MKPVGKRIIVKPVKEEEKKGLLIIPESKSKSEKMEIIAISEDLDEDGLQLSNFFVGDFVLLEKYAGQPIMISGEEHFIVKEEQVIAIY